MGRRRTLVAAIASTLALGLGLSVAAARSTPGVVTIRVPGARTVSVYCGGETTVHADGAEARIEPVDVHCFIEAPWSPAMPLRGEFDLTGRPTVECRRDNMRLDCR